MEAFRVDVVPGCAGPATVFPGPIGIVSTCFARAQGLTRLSLETGSGPAFEPALSMYRRRGFQPGGAFGEYEASAFNQFMHLDL